MESRAKLAGHAIHPMLVVFPLGLFATAVIFDLITVVSHIGKFAEVSFYMIAAGILAGLVAAIFGAIDWFAIPRGTRARTIGLWHGIGNVVVVGLFAASWVLRRDEPVQPPTVALILSLLGAGIAFVTGWLGGELVERLGIGVDDNAHVNAPSSLKGDSMPFHGSHNRA